MKYRKIIILLFCISGFVFQAISFADVASQVIPSSYFGNHINRKKDWPTIPIGALRMWDDQTNWKKVEKNRGEYDWSKLDYWLAQAESHGIDVVYTFGHTPPWSTLNGEDTVPPSDMAIWDEFVTALVSRYKGRIKFYEGWNEPDYRHFWTGTEEELIELQKHAYQIIHRIDPQARVLTPTPTARNPGEWLGRFFDAGGGAYADIISFHGYTHPDSEKIVGIIKGVQDAMRQYHQEEKPLWITEGSWGKPTKLSDPDLQAGFVAKHNLLIWANGVERFYWYGWDYPTGRLWDEDNGIHNTGIAYREIQKWMIGSIMDQPCAMDGQETWTCGLKFADGSHGLVVWNSQQTQKYHPKEKFTQVFDLEGHSSSMSDDITIGDKPVLLK